MNQKSLMRFYAKIEVDEQTGCWVWTGGLNHHGYGQAWVDGKNQLAHRASYEHFVGEIGEGLELDHTCRRHACVCPNHLEPVTGLENLVRKYAAINMSKIFTVYWITPKTKGIRV